MLEQQDHISIQASTVATGQVLQKTTWNQDTHYYILLTVGTGIQVSGRLKQELQ